MFFFCGSVTLMSIYFDTCSIPIAMEEFDEIDLPVMLPKAVWVEKKMYLLETQRNYLGFCDPANTSTNHETTQVWIEWPTMMHVLKDLQDSCKITQFVSYEQVKEFQFYTPETVVPYHARSTTYEYFDSFFNKWLTVKVFNLDYISWWKWVY
jgi:hypothetical protein